MKRIVLFLSLAVTACRGPVQTAPLPPRFVPSVLGPVPIFYVDTIVHIDSTKYLVGGYDYYGRRVLIRREALRSPLTAHMIAAHEACHVALVDAGIRLDGPVVELICDAMASVAVAQITRKP